MYLKTASVSGESFVQGDLQRYIHLAISWETTTVLGNRWSLSSTVA